MDVTIEAEDLLKWARYFDEMPAKIKPAMAHALNYIGDQIVDKTVRYIADTTGLDPEDVRGMIVVSRATPNNWEWSMDASVVAPPSLDWSRPWDSRSSSTADPFAQQTLVKVVTMEDEAVCQRCQDAAEDSPYTLEQAQALLPVHPHCRCLLQPYSSHRRLPVTFGQAGATPPELHTARQIAEAVKDSLTVVMRAKPS
jgi:hypothetical protein